MLELEGAVRRLLKPLGSEMIMEFVRQLAQKQSGERPQCCCGASTKYGNIKPLTLLSMLDPIQLKRPYYSCSACGHGTIPLDQTLGIGPGGLTPALEEAVSMLGGCVPFELGVKLVRKLLAVDLPAKSAQRVTQRIGAELEAQQQETIRRAWQDYEFPPMEGAAPAILYLSTDGAQVRLEDGFHEAKIAAFHQAALRTNRKGEAELHAVDITYVVAVDEPAAEFAKRVLVEGYRRGWQQAGLVVVLGDGAAWIWEHIATQVPDNVVKIEIVDFYHVSEHLWKVGKAVFGEESEETKLWVEARLKELRAGAVTTVIHELVDLWTATGADPERLAHLGDEKAKDLPEPRKTIRETWTYLTNNQHRMHYDQYRAKGLFIGSGTVESACKRIIGARLKQSGMRWSREGAQYVLQIRAAFLSDRDYWDRFWGSRQPPPRHHHYRAKAA
jgi:hypothetical protein